MQKPNRVGVHLAVVNDEPPQPFTVVIVYDDRQAGQRAVRLFSSLGRSEADLPNFQPLPWRFDLLGDADWCQLASADLAKADLLIISTSAESDLPLAVRLWLSAGLKAKNGQHAAVVALFGPGERTDGLDSPRIRFVQELAQEAGLDFFAPANLESSRTKSVTLPEHRIWSPSELDDYSPAALAAGSSSPVHRRHWGINE